MKKENNINKFFEKIDQYKTFKENLVVWMGLRACDYSMIKFINPDLIASTRYGTDIMSIENRYPVFSTEKNTKIRTNSSMQELDPYIREIFDYVSQYNVQTYFVCYHSTPQLEMMVSKYPDLHILNPPYYLKTFLDKKSLVRKALRKLDVNVIPGIEAPMSKGLFDMITKKYNLPFVVSFDDSAGGYGVNIINNQTEFLNLEKETRGKSASFTKFIDGKSMSISAVRTIDYVIKSEPSLQIIGQKECSLNPFGWCGNDFNIINVISEEEILKMYSIVDKVGSWLDKLDYRGIFGIDFIADNNDVYFTEINPRFLGTSSLLVDRQMELGKIPLSFFHLVPYLNGLYLNDEFVNDYNSMKTPLNVSQIVLHNISGKDIIIDSMMKPGRYILEDRKMLYLGPGDNLSDTRSYDEFILTGDIPLQGTRVLANSDEICKILMYDNALDKKGRSLNRYATDLVNMVHQQFVFKKE